MSNRDPYSDQDVDELLFEFRFCVVSLSIGQLYLWQCGGGVQARIGSLGMPDFG